jgi:hypothetical protein
LALPALAGQPIRVCLRRTLGSHLAATHISKRFILLDRAVLARRGDFERILVHEVFHFAWVRLGNVKRLGWETLLAAECTSKTAGELGWSAEWRKDKLAPSDIRSRTPAWRRYACESFCDTAAWLYARLARHEEFTLTGAACAKRKAWFREYIECGPVSI